jgi:hypothetical protein
VCQRGFLPEKTALGGWELTSFAVKLSRGAQAAVPLAAILTLSFQPIECAAISNVSPMNASTC